MKSRYPVLAILLGFALVAGLALAATAPAASPPSRPAPAAPPAGPGPGDEIRARLGQRLGLTADQQSSIDALRAKQREEVAALVDANDLTPESRRDRIRAVVDNYHAQMRAVLTPEQQRQMGERRGQMMARGGRPGPDFPRSPRGGDLRGAARRPADPMAVVAMGERIKDRLAEKLQLTDEQRDKLDHLGRAYRAQQREAAKKHREEMRAVLTPEQQEKAGQMRQQGRPGPEGGRPPRVGWNEEDESAAPDLAVLASDS